MRAVVVAVIALLLSGCVSIQEAVLVAPVGRPVVILRADLSATVWKGFRDVLESGFESEGAQIKSYEDEWRAGEYRVFYGTRILRSRDQRTYAVNLNIIVWRKELDSTVVLYNHLHSGTGAGMEFPRRFLRAIAEGSPRILMQDLILPDMKERETFRQKRLGVVA